MSSIYQNKTIFYEANQLNIKGFSKAVFFDRDGVINEDCHYIKEPNRVKLCIGVRELIREIYVKNIPIVIITNQSGISKNLLTWKDYHLVTEKILKELGYPNPVSAIYANSYKDTQNKSSWRKPNPNMIMQASKDLKIDLEKSILIGDRLTDLQAGFSSGIKNLVHVLTGHGIKEREDVINHFKIKSLKKNGKKSSPFLIKNLLEFPIELLS